MVVVFSFVSDETLAVYTVGWGSLSIVDERRDDGTLTQLVVFNLLPIHYLWMSAALAAGSHIRMLLSKDTFETIKKIHNTHTERVKRETDRG